MTPAFVASVTVTKQTDFPDDKVTGLVLRVTPTGVKTWSIRYRFHGQSRRLALGSSVELTPAKARELAAKKLGLVRNDIDPAEAKRKRLPTGHTVDALVRDYLLHKQQAKKRSWKHEQSVLRCHVLPQWKHVKVIDITRRDVRELVEPIAARGTRVMANQVLAILCTLFNFGIRRDWMTVNPAYKLERPGGHIPSRDRVLTDEELRLFWQLCDHETLVVSTYLKLRLVTAQRRGELAQLTWADVEKGFLNIPGRLTKNGKAHRVPLSPLAQQLLDGLPRINDRLFPGRHGTSGLANLYAAAGRIQQRMLTLAKAADPEAVMDFRGHDLRRTAATLMGAEGIPQAHIAQVLNHSPAGPKVTQTYMRYEFDKEKKIALDALARKVQSILAEQAGEAVLPFARRKR